MNGLLRWTSRLLPVLLIGGLVAAGAVVSTASADERPAECFVSAVSLGEAKDLYGRNCSLPRVDCDRLDGIWFCSSRVIGEMAPGGVTPEDGGRSGIGGPTTSVAPPSTAVPTTVAPPTTAAPSTTAAPPTPTTPAPTTPPDNGECGVVVIEAEDLPVVGAWRVVDDPSASGGQYIVWEGLSESQNNNSPADVITTALAIDKSGSYRFTWAMRQPDGVDSDKANDSWLNIPDASRFGPVSGGDYPGFIKVYGNSKGEFAYSATADVNHNKSPIAIDFETAGVYTLQVAGRSHGHQIDRIVVHHDSVSRADAIAGRGADCGGAQPTTTLAPPTTLNPTTTQMPTTTQNPGDCTPNTSGRVDLARDMISLHYDHAPDRDDTHASAAAKEVATRIGFTPWVIGGAYGADNGGSYQSRTEPVMDATWGASNWINADADWDRAVQRTADRWQQTLQACGDVWIAEGGQSDLSADIVRELKLRMPGLDTRRIHLVQHSNWNEEKALDADLAYVKDNTDYIRIADGNGGGNGTADFNDERYNGPFVATALNGGNAAGWRAAFDYYSPQSERLDFSDTVELMEILGVGTDQVDDIEDFADVFMR